MKIAEIKNELNKIYEERNKWYGGKGPFTKDEILRKELILMKQQVLYKLEDAKKLKKKQEVLFWLELYKVIQRWILKISGNKQK